MYTLSIYQICMNLFLFLKYFLLTYPHSLSLTHGQSPIASQQLLSLHFQLVTSHRNNYSLGRVQLFKSCTLRETKENNIWFPIIPLGAKYYKLQSARELISHTVNFAQWGPRSKTSSSIIPLSFSSLVLPQAVSLDLT